MRNLPGNRINRTSRPPSTHRTWSSLACVVLPARSMPSKTISAPRTGGFLLPPAVLSPALLLLLSPSLPFPFAAASAAAAAVVASVVARWLPPVSSTPSIRSTEVGVDGAAPTLAPVDGDVVAGGATVVPSVCSGVSSPTAAAALPDPAAAATAAAAAAAAAVVVACSPATAGDGVVGREVSPGSVRSCGGGCGWVGELCCSATADEAIVAAVARSLIDAMAN